MRPPVLRLHQDELIVDSFAGGGGASLGIEMALGRSPDIAVNHDPEAIAMHAANHPQTRHFCENVWDVDPVTVCAGRPVGLAWFSPDCTYHSKARGGKPFRDRNKARRRRGLAWLVVRWAKAVRPRIICLENVEEFADWGPLLADGRPDPAKRGFTFRRWQKQLKNLGYAVEMRELRACDYGAPTTRKRLFIVARCDGQPIVWPEPTHGPQTKTPTLWGATFAPYRTAAECIDWSLPCPSIFDRKKPLAENTLKRIARGIQRYVIDAVAPFIVPVTHHGDSRAHSIHEPMRTITGAHRGEQALIMPYVLPASHGSWPDGPDLRSNSVEEPLRTIATLGAQYYMVAAFMAKHYTGVVGSDLRDPVDTVTAVDHNALVACHLQRDFGQSIGSALADPVLTITGGGGGHAAMVASHLLKLRGGLDDHHTTAQDMREPVPTLTAGGTHLAEVRAFLIKYYGSDQDPQIGHPLHTITTKDRFGLVTVRGEQYAIADIGMRMLAPRELFRAQGFPDSYKIDIVVNGKPLSKTAQVRCCGNSVCPPLAAALVAANVDNGLEATG